MHVSVRSVIRGLPCLFLFMMIAGGGLDAAAFAQASGTEAGTLAASVATAVASGDPKAAAAYLTPDAVVTFQNGDVCRGRDEAAAYVRGMFRGQKALIQTYTATPTVDSVVSVGPDATVASGTSTDRLLLSSGAEMNLQTTWTATLVRREGAWQIASLHLSTNMLDNPIIGKMKTTFYLVGLFGFVMGISLGAGVMLVLRRRPDAPARR